MVLLCTKMYLCNWDHYTVWLYLGECRMIVPTTLQRGPSLRSPWSNLVRRWEIKCLTKFHYPLWDCEFLPAHRDYCVTDPDLLPLCESPRSRTKIKLPQVYQDTRSRTVNGKAVGIHCGRTDMGPTRLGCHGMYMFFHCYIISPLQEQSCHKKKRKLRSNREIHNSL